MKLEVGGVLVSRNAVCDAVHASLRRIEWLADRVRRSSSARLTTYNGWYRDSISLSLDIELKRNMLAAGTLIITEAGVEVCWRETWSAKVSFIKCCTCVDDIELTWRSNTGDRILADKEQDLGALLALDSRERQVRATFANASSHEEGELLVLGTGIWVLVLLRGRDCGECQRGDEVEAHLARSRCRDVNVQRARCSVVDV